MEVKVWKYVLHSDVILDTRTSAFQSNQIMLSLVQNGTTFAKNRAEVLNFDIRNFVGVRY